MSGIEVAGLLFGILPLFIEVGKSYQKAATNFLDVTIQSRHDEALEEFYDEFYEQVVEIHEHMKTIHNSVSKMHRSNNSLPTTQLLMTWHEDPDLGQTLKSYFKSEDRYNRFTRISNNIVRLLGSLVEDKSVPLTQKDQEESQMFQTLQQFIQQRGSTSARTSFVERIRFFKRQNKRDSFLRKLKTCTQSLEKLLLRVELQQSRPDPDELANAAVMKAQAHTLSRHSIQLRALSSSLHKAMEKHWDCGCTKEHDVKVHLKESKDIVDTDVLSIEFLVHTDPDNADYCCWQEASACVASGTVGSSGSRKTFNKICELLQPVATKLSLNFIIDNHDGQESMWQISPKPRKRTFCESEGPSSLNELLIGPGKMMRQEKLALALRFAYSLILFHDSAWLSDGWKKEDMFFFYSKEDEPDYTNPYFSAQLWKGGRDSNNGNASFPSRNASILAFGILLLEIFEEKPIEKWRTKKEWANLYEFTDWDVAERVVKKMDPSPSQTAVRACLDWVRHVVDEVDLEKEDTRAELFKRVIWPLEKDWESSQLRF